MTGKKKIGFAAMNPERQKEIARKGGSNVPKEKRSFWQNRELARKAGAIGGQSVAAHKRSFSTNRGLASEAGKRGGREAQVRHAEKKTQSGSTGA